MTDAPNDSASPDMPEGIDPEIRDPATERAANGGDTRHIVRFLIVKALVFMLFPAVLTALAVFFMI
ncbi:phosphoribosylformylglycinamidine synthase-associated small membrane protein [Breoghania sp.]|uniref:phosphoribosylformylglycinamidine synthase-associated small membrane protein n=1 Tax=Breoghania sp. TaxID=2065378 RepID=UPI00262914CA|nr:phosphoribosylformylglycinamidine synthase-associated small membrane protein [Breoghania sp.]MDJ0931370.1 phosphoribosylformylglycinamidine synthase-associated small membrane protein [Breoghania sp.]